MTEHTPQDEAVAKGFDEFAERRGLPVFYHDLQGEIRVVPQATRIRMLAALGEVFDPLAKADEPGDMDPPRLELDQGIECYLPAFLENGRVWGISLQLYELRSERNWGIGDFADLETTCGIASAAGGDFIGLNPLHALFLAEPYRCSPYSPSSRRFLNPLYIAVDRLPGFQPELSDQQAVRELRSSDTIDYAAVAELKLTELRKLWDEWKTGDAEEDKAFERFTAEEGEGLRRHALFEALSFHMTAAGLGSGWSGWPEGYQRYDSDTVRIFAEQNRDEIEFHIWLQWIAARQLREAADHARRLGMRIGLYFDFAVGEAPDGSTAWGSPDLILPGLRVGAPPDVFSTYGQDWGLMALSPRELERQGMRPYDDLLGASMRYAGALRIDHAMALWQLFVLPEGETPAVGGYLRYPFQDMVRALSEVSHRTETIVIGEDLGNVPEGFREEMEKAKILGYRVLYFEDADNGVFDPGGLAPLSLACLGTHDLPPLIAWWRGDDIALAQTLGLTDKMTADGSLRERSERRSAFIEAVRKANPEVAEGMFEMKDRISQEIIVAIHQILARSGSRVVAVRLADLVGEDRPTNVPGTSGAYPNWKLKLRVAIEDIPQTSLFKSVTAAVSAERPKV